MRYKKATKLAAPEYVDALMNWAQGLLDNEELFPSEMGACSSVRRSRLYMATCNRPTFARCRCRR